MIRWGSPQLLYLLLAVPVLLVLLAVGAWLKRRDLARLADPELVPRLTDSREPRLAATRTTLLVLGLVFAILAAARPQWGEKLQVYKGRGIDVVIALDASKSMLATDVRPSRLARAKTELASLLDQLSTNQVGIVAFAGDAHVMCPLTPDVEAAKLFLDIVDPDNMPRPGTNIEQAVATATSLFDPRQSSSKALLLVTDGDNLEGDPGAATARAARAGVRIFAVGVGTLEGTTVPENAAGGTSYKKDDKDQIVISRLAERLLLVMAKATGGRYFRSESVNLDALVQALDQMQKKQIAGGEYVEYEEHYQAFLLIAFLLTLAGLLLGDRRGAWFERGALPRLRRRGTPGAGGAAAVLLALALAATPARAGVGSLMRQGLHLERQGKFAEALRRYQDALVLEPDNERIHYDQGRALYRLNKQPEAIAEFQLGLLSKSRRLRARSLYNIGNAQFRQGQLDAAIASYSQALLLQPGDREARHNLEFCWKMKEQPPDTSRKQPQQQPQQQPQPQQRQPQSAPAQARPGEISRDQADRMLQALQGREREDMKKKQQRSGPPAAGGKDW
jgi:Ca-activated chloride channel homolog